MPTAAPQSEDSADDAGQGIDCLLADWQEVLLPQGGRGKPCCGQQGDQPMKQEILTLEQGQVADMLLSLKNSHRRINRFLQEYTPPLNGDRYLTDKEVAEVLKVSRRTLQNLRNNRVLPFILLGGKALYREYDIQRLLEANYRKADV